MNIPGPGRARVTTAIAVLLAAVGGPVGAQPAPAEGDRPAAEQRRVGPRWSYLDAVGYAGLGFASGLAATWNLEGTDFGPPGEAVAVIVATTLAGGVTGAVLGRRAEAAAAGGRRVGGLHRAAVLGGVVLAGGTAGALAAVPLVNPDGQGTPLGSDEQTVTLLVLAGSAAGAAYAWSRSEALGSRLLALAPVMLAGRRPGVALRFGRSSLPR